MQNFTIRDVLKATDGKLISGDMDQLISSISTDSRTLEKDDFFVALIGDKFDGHDFIPQAMSKGAMGFLISKDVNNLFLSFLGGADTSAPNIILVDDTLKALGDIAKAYRLEYNIPIIGITGSNGKTTTKDMITNLLRRRYNILSNKGNLNNAIGLPLTIFNFTSDHEIGVLEMGTGSPGEMSWLVEMAHPNVAVVTNVGPTHLEFFETMDAVAEEKGLLVEVAGSAVLNADDPRVAGMSKRTKGEVIYYGIENGDVRASEIMQNNEGKSIFTLSTNSDQARIHLQSLGNHNIYNALAASATGLMFDMTLQEIGDSLQDFTDVPMRMQRRIINGISIIDDTYNSNLGSLKAALNYLSSAKCKGRKIAVLGDMLELGTRSEELHRKAGRYVAQGDIDLLITAGKDAEIIYDSALKTGFPKEKAITCESNLEAADHLRWEANEDDLVLIKGSRGMKMEEIIKLLEE
ncbi:UDP-N-acetylmuramoyl-tripeptide--D-alanyl-D-alanine ligase [Candidatus Poribacteria bacterium]|nr:UDP-N-acetylmuramoyl-tripeptide--D-alanyl-D-alanine ligase [Candidatus Poribacteria bacterium]